MAIGVTTVGVTLEFPEMSTAQHDRIRGLMGMSPGGPGPAGLLSHWVSVEEPGMFMTDVWDSREHFEEFARDEIGPLSRQAGVTAPPKTTFDEVHGYLTAGAGAAPTAPVAVIMEFADDIQKYDEVLELMGLTPRGPGPDGCLFHWATAIEGVIRVTDLWQDRATFEAFSETQIGPYAAKAGMAPPESTVVRDVYDFFTAGP